jgi:hypothetical protein
MALLCSWFLAVLKVSITFPQLLHKIECVSTLLRQVTCPILGAVEVLVPIEEQIIEWSTSRPRWQR